MNLVDSITELERRIALFNLKFRESGSIFCISYCNPNGWHTIDFSLDDGDWYYTHAKQSTRDISEFLEHLDSIVLHNTLTMLASGKYYLNRKTFK